MINTKTTMNKITVMEQKIKAGELKHGVRSILKGIIATAILYMTTFSPLLWRGAGGEVFSQNIGINTTGATPNASAGLDVSFTNKGLLIPRLTYAQRTTAGTALVDGSGNLPAAAQGLIVYQTDAGGDGEGFYYNTSTTVTPSWVKMFAGASSGGWALSGNTLTGTLPASPNEWIGTANAADWVLKTNNTERIRVQSDGNVGIGSTSPAYKFDLLGNPPTVLARITNTNSSGLLLQGGAGVGEYILELADRIGNVRVEFEPDGNVGIGTTSPAALLHVEGSTDNLLTVKSTNDLGNALTIGYNDPTNALFINTVYGDGNRLDIRNAGVPLVTVLNGGNVGIGTIAPATKLEVSAPNNTHLLLRSETYAVNQSVQYSAHTGTGTAESDIMGAIVYTITQTSPLQTSVTFRNNKGDNSDPFMTAVANGSIGIGTTIPQNKLTVEGNADPSFGVISIFGQTGANGSFLFTAHANNTAASQVFGITRFGNVGIGTSSPQRKLDLSNTGQLTFGDDVINNSTTGIYWYSGSDYSLARTSGAWSAPNYQQLLMKFATGIIIDGGSAYGKSGTVMQPNGGNVGIGTTTVAYTLQINGTAACNSGTWSASDGRYKKNIIPVNGALQKVEALQGVTYQWDLEKTKADSLNMDERTYLGFIAQEVQKVLPQAVQQANGDKMLRVDYSQITPILVEAIKELSRQNMEQQKIIDTMQKQIEKLEQK